MLKAYRYKAGKLSLIDWAAAPLEAREAIWFDIENPEPQDYALVARETGLDLPKESDIVEIENSSRLSIEDKVLTLTMPLITRDEDGLRGTACGFVLAPDRLVSIRLGTNIVFNHFVETPHTLGDCPAGGLFAALLEAMTDRQADAFEHLRCELDGLSHRIFHHRFAGRSDTTIRGRSTEAELQANLIMLGRNYDTVTLLRDSQLGIGRIAAYVRISAEWLPAAIKSQLHALEKDVASLNEYSTHLTDKVQFLLDTTLGLINIAQNSLIKVLTIVSIVGIPPTLIAGIYGMNFHDMPELSWTYGYPYAWGLMIASAVLPLVWFRAKGWI